MRAALTRNKLAVHDSAIYPSSSYQCTKIISQVKTAMIITNNESLREREGGRDLTVMFILIKINANFPVSGTASQPSPHPHHLTSL